MGAFTYIETDTGTNVDISAATAVGAYTASGDKLIMVDVSIDAVAGNGDYVMYVTRQIGGSGSAYRILPITTMAAASGLTAISAQSGWITVRNGDVLTVYVDGLAGDTSTPDWTTRWFELAGVTAAGIADAVLDEATSGHTSAGSFSKAVTDILADTGTDGVVLKAAGLADDAVNEIVDQVWNEAIADHVAAGSFGAKNQKVVPSETVGDYKADVSALATQTSVNAIPTSPLLAANYVAPDNAGIGAIKTKTDQLVFTTPNKVDASATIDPTGLATSAALATVDGIVDDIKVKTDQLTFTVANKVDASATVDPTGIATSAALAVVDANVDAIKAKTDQLDYSAVTVVTAVVGSDINILRGDTFDDPSISDLGDLNDYVSLDFTIKTSKSSLDNDAIIRIRKNASGTGDGLLRLNGAAHTTGTDGSLTITDAATGDVTIMLKAAITDDLAPGSYVYDIQKISATKVKTLTSGKAVVTSDVTRAIA